MKISEKVKKLEFKILEQGKMIMKNLDEHDNLRKLINDLKDNKIITCGYCGRKEFESIVQKHWLKVYWEKNAYSKIGIKNAADPEYPDKVYFLICPICSAHDTYKLYEKIIKNYELKLRKRSFWKRIFKE